MKLFWPGHFTVKMAPPTARYSDSNGLFGQPTKDARRQVVVPGSATSVIPPTSDIIEVNFRYTALIGMCLGFLFIWSTVVSSIFMKNSIDEKMYMQEPVGIFHNQERIGRIMFQIGQEMRKFSLIY